jgi:hypothetical protein
MIPKSDIPIEILAKKFAKIPEVKVLIILMSLVILMSSLTLNILNILIIPLMAECLLLGEILRFSKGKVQKKSNKNQPLR